MQLEGQKYPYISSLSLHFLLVFKDAITPPTGHSVSPPAHADFLPFESIHHVILWLIILIKICFLVIDSKLLQVCTSCSYSSVLQERKILFFFFLIDLVYYLASSTQQKFKKSSNKCVLHWIDVFFLEIRTYGACWLNGILSNKLESWI